MALNRIFYLLLTLLLAVLMAAGAQLLPSADAVFPTSDMAEIRLGRLLFYDPILSGGKTLACGTCHNPRYGTSDGLSLGLGDGGAGLGRLRRADPKNPPEQLIGRNAPTLFNLGSPGFRSLFHDGRLEADATRKSGIRTPLGADMEVGFASILAAQAMFPVIAGDEMAGHYNESDVSRAARIGRFTGKGGVWDILAARVAAIPGYRARFGAVLGAGHVIRFTDIANAIAAFTSYEWRADNSPFDQFLRVGTPLPAAAAKGMALFYGSAGCAACHSGQFQSDQQFHAIAMPQIGPGKAARFETGHQDLGRMRVTGKVEDAYKFRTPSLRNVALSAPYGHDGAYATLAAILRHHLDPVRGLYTYDQTQALLPDLAASVNFSVQRDSVELAAIASANELAPNPLSKLEQGQILAFLNSLTDPVSRTGRLGVPASVPSGLPVDQ